MLDDKENKPRKETLRMLTRTEMKTKLPWVARMADLLQCLIALELELEFLSSIKRPILTYGTRVYMCS